uniref:WGS project CBMF000000000 data, contig CS5834_c001357 n=1 Tax=Fusarium pseudograminearum CS5834 TaxID=1318459 RepID=A0A096PF48_FUSPS|nr:unnamed protein product [Fusarium pseudograminearum CS5834]
MPARPARRSPRSQLQHEERRRQQARERTNRARAAARQRASANRPEAHSQPYDQVEASLANPTTEAQVVQTPIRQHENRISKRRTSPRSYPAITDSQQVLGNSQLAKLSLHPPTPTAANRKGETETTNTNSNRSRQVRARRRRSSGSHSSSSSGGGSSPQPRRSPRLQCRGPIRNIPQLDGFPAVAESSRRPILALPPSTAPLSQQPPAENRRRRGRGRPRKYATEVERAEARQKQQQGYRSRGHDHDRNGGIRNEDNSDRFQLEPTGDHEGTRATEPNSYPNPNVPYLPPTAATAARQETADVIHVSTSPEVEVEVELEPELEAEPKLAGQGGQSTQLDANSTLPGDAEVTDQIVQWGNRAETADSIPIYPPRPSASTARDDKEDADTGSHADSSIDILRSPVPPPCDSNIQQEPRQDIAIRLPTTDTDRQLPDQIPNDQRTIADSEEDSEAEGNVDYSLSLIGATLNRRSSLASSDTSLDDLPPLEELIARSQATASSPSQPHSSRSSQAAAHRVYGEGSQPASQSRNLQPTPYREPSLAAITSFHFPPSRDSTIHRRAGYYSQVLRSFFAFESQDIMLDDPPAAPTTTTPILRPSLPPSPTSLLAVEDDNGNLDPPTHSFKERADHIASTLPPLSSILEPRPALGPESWAPFLSEKPSAKLSFAKTEAELPADRSITITRWWDIDSIWLGIRSLDALQPHAGVFSLSFLPSPKLNISSDQIIQPHGINLAKTKHLQLGSFRTPYVRFTIFLFFPNATVSQGAAAAPNAISTALSDERLQELYDRIIIPAAFEASVAPCVQELPTSFNTAKRKSHCYQERPGTDRWQANDSSRATHLQYPFPAQDLAAFSRLLVEKADAATVRSRRTESDFSYFASPKLVLQSHDLKNPFEGATLEGVIDQLGRNVLSCFRPEQLDLESFWLDIGCRDYPATPAYASQPLTLLWKEPEHKRRHRELVNITRELCRESHLPWPTYFQSYLLHQSGTYTSKAPLPSTSSPSAHSQRLCIPRAKAYNCNKELFATMHSDYQLFGAPSLPLLALPQELIDQLHQANQKGHRAADNRQKRGQILHAWNTCKAHVNAAQSSRQVSHYGVRREVTFRLDGILYLWKTNAFRPEDPWRMSCGPVAESFQPSDLASNRLPFWVLPTKHVNQLIVINAARFIRPLDYLFHEATSSPATPLATDPDDNRDARSGRLPDRMDLDRPDPTEPADLLQQDPSRKASLLISLYTAKLLMRLLVLSLTSEARYPFDRWIWEAEWRARPGSQETLRMSQLHKSG